MFRFSFGSNVALSPADTISLVSRIASSCVRALHEQPKKNGKNGDPPHQQLLKIFPTPPLLGWFHANEASLELV